LAAAPVSSKIMGVVILILLMVVGGLTLRPAPTPLRAATVAPTAETAPLLPLANPAPALPSAPALTAAPLPSPASPQEIAQEFFQTYKDGGGRAVVDKYGATLPKDDIDLLPSYLRNPEAMNVNGNGDSETWVEGVVDALTKGGDWTTNRYMMKIEHHQVTGFLATPPGMN